MKAISLNNLPPNEFYLGKLIFNKILNNQTLESYPSAQYKSRCNHRCINLPPCFEVLDNHISSNDINHICVSSVFGIIKYNSFDKNCILFGRFCEIYKIHVFMNKHGINHWYNGLIINYFDRV